MSAVLQPRNESTGEATTLAHLVIRVCDAIEKQLSQFERASPTIREVLLGTTHERLSAVAFDEFDSLKARLQAHLDEHGCSVCTAFNGEFALTDLLLRMESTAESLKPYRALRKK